MPRALFVFARHHSPHSITLPATVTPRAWNLRNDKAIALDRPVVIAILNLTPDSFSDGGQLPSDRSAAEAADLAIRGGADMLDLGGESTRPGASRIPAHEQIRRVIPAIREIRRRHADIPISIDTTLAAVASAAIDAGADAVNDVSAAREDDAMLPLVASTGAGLILMHRLAPPDNDRYSHQYATPPDYPAPGGVVAAVLEFLRARTRAAIDAGVHPSRLVVDPGLGFGKSVNQNFELLHATPRLRALGFPVLSALSRKSFTARAALLSPDLPPTDRLHATLALSVSHLLAGASLFRVHDVRPHREALDAAWTAAQASDPIKHLSDPVISAPPSGPHTLPA